VALEQAVEALAAGIDIGAGILEARRKGRGRLAEEENLELAVDGKRVASAKVFRGREPHYHPWVELYVVSPEFYGSPAEEALVSLLSEHLPPGGRVFVEYGGDDETREGLIRGFPVVATRMGHLLFRHGFTWFKDWYFPEGFYEGDIKLQGEKPADDAARHRHMREIEGELKEFLGDGVEGRLVQKAAEHAHELLNP
jgi:hypothetical protein